MSKPIFVVRLPHSTDVNIIAQYNHTRVELEKKLNDYHVLTIMDNSVEAVQFESYNSSHTEIEFEELKKMVISKIKIK